ncbi:MAG TPA: response regulator [Tepidisphaeraceae bacterium]|jgi:DNA-binding response OmpR family regulator
MMTQSANGKCKTLIVEDDEPAARALAKVLTSKGHEVNTAGTVGDALAELAGNPGCVILDLILPDGNGITVLRRIRRAGMEMRVAIVTGMRDPFGIDDITDLKPDAVFEKPVDAEELVKWLKKGKRKTGAV